MSGRIGKSINRAERIGAIALLSAIVALVAVASVARAVGSPIIWSVEIAQLLFAWLCMICADLAMQQQRHFGLSVLHAMLDERGRYWLDIINHLVLIGLLAFLFVYAWRNMILMHPRLIGATQMHGSWVHASMVLGMVLLLRTLLSQLIDRIAGKSGDPAFESAS